MKPTFRTIIVLALALCVATMANAGITVHFEGRVATPDALDKMGAAVCAKASSFGWECKPIAGDEIRAADPITAKIISELEGTTDLASARGVVVHADPKCEPIYLVAGASGKIKNFVKTQFAGADVHVKVVELLEVAKSNLSELTLQDEGGYAETKNRNKLESELEGVNVMIAKIQKDHPEARGPIKRPDGRILDLVRSR